MSGRLVQAGREALRRGSTPGGAEEALEMARIDPGQIDGHPAESANVRRPCERLRVEVEQLGLLVEAGLDRDRGRALPADREDLVANAERDVGLPGHPLLRLRQGEGDASNILEGHHRDPRSLRISTPASS